MTASNALGEKIPISVSPLNQDASNLYEISPVDI